MERGKRGRISSVQSVSWMEMTRGRERNRAVSEWMSGEIAVFERGTKKKTKKKRKKDGRQGREESTFLFLFYFSAGTWFFLLFCPSVLN